MEDFQIRQAADAVMIVHGDVLEERWAMANDGGRTLLSAATLERNLRTPSTAKNLLGSASEWLSVKGPGMIIEFALGRLNSLRELKAP